MSVSKRLLRLLSDIGEVSSLNDLLLKTGLSLSTLRRYVKELVKTGYVIEKDGVYTISEKARFALEGERLRHKTVAEGSSYMFTDSRGSPLILKIDSIEKLYIAIKYGFVPQGIVMEHVGKGYLVKWLIEVLGANMLAKRISNARNIEEVLKILEEYLGY